MTASYSISKTESFTHTDARKLGAKVATDLKRMQRFYGYPSDSCIADFEAEIVDRGEIAEAACQIMAGDHLIY